MPDILSISRTVLDISNGGGSDDGGGAVAAPGITVHVEGNWSEFQPMASGQFLPLKPNNLGTNTGNYNASTGVFTVPEDGIYEFYAYVHDNTLSNERTIMLWDQGGNRVRDLVYVHPSESRITLSGRALMTCTAGQQIRVIMYSASGSDVQSPYSSMSICQIA